MRKTTETTVPDRAWAQDSLQERGGAEDAGSWHSCGRGEPSWEGYAGTLAARVLLSPSLCQVRRPAPGRGGGHPGNIAAGTDALLPDRPVPRGVRLLRLLLWARRTRRTQGRAGQVGAPRWRQWHRRCLPGEARAPLLLGRHLVHRELTARLASLGWLVRHGAHFPGEWLRLSLIGGHLPTKGQSLTDQPPEVTLQDICDERQGGSQ